MQYQNKQFTKRSEKTFYVLLQTFIKFDKRHFMTDHTKARQTQKKQKVAPLWSQKPLKKTFQFSIKNFPPALAL